MKLPSNGLSPFVNAVARTLFVQAWADYQDHFGSYPAGSELMDIAPETPVEAYYAAGHLVAEFERLNKRPWYVIIPDARQRVTSGYDAEVELGYYLAMTSVGHGVAWEDRHEKLDVEYPHSDFTFYDLSDANYPIPEENDE